MKKTFKRTLSMLCALMMVLSLAAMIAPSAKAAYVGSSTAAEFKTLMDKTHPVHYHEYVAANGGFSNQGSGLVDDPDAVGGKAVLHDYDKINGADANEGTNLNGGYGFDINHTGSGLHLGKIPGNQIQVDGQYHVYKLTVEIPADMSAGGGIVYLFGTWQIQPKGMGDHLFDWRGKTVDLYISMKATGSVSQAKCYIDRVVLMESCDDYASDSGEYCSRCGSQLSQTALPKAKDIIADLNVSNFYLPYGDPKVDGAAVISYANRTHDQGLMNSTLFAGSRELTLRMQVEGVSDEAVGAINALRLNANSRGGEFVVYKFANKVLIPEKGPTAHKFYMFDCWGFQVDLAGYVDQLVGQTVDVYLSLKVTGTVTNTTDDTPAYYIDRIIIAKPEVEQVPAYDAASVLFTATSADFHRPYGDPVVEDAYAPNGSAALYSYERRFGTEDKGLYNAMIRTGGQTLELRTKGADGILIGSLSVAELQKAGAIGEYVTYKFSNITFNANDIYMFDCWGFQIYYSKFGAAVAGKTCNVYLTMKITGDCTNTTTNTPAYYIDSVTITDAALDFATHTHVYSECAKLDNDNHVKICLNCGETATESHSWDEGIVDENHIITYTCSGCNGTKQEVEEISYFYAVYQANDFARPYGDPIEDGCVVYSFETRYANGEGDKSLYNAMIRSGEQVLDVRTNTGIEVGNISVYALQAAGKTEEFITYKFENVQLTDANFIYIFDCWGFQAPLTAHKAALANLPVNVYVTMKITGDCTNTGDNSPTYYMSKIEIIEAAADTEAHEHTFSDMLDINNDVHGKICTTCGLLDSAAHDWDDGTSNGETITYHCATCGGSKTEAAPSPVKNWNLVLDGNIAANFYLDITDETAADAIATVSVAGGAETTLDVASLSDGNGNHVLTVELAAAQMADEIVVTVNGITKTYSVQKYAQIILGDADQAAYHDLVKYMLAYGAASQSYFGYKPETAPVVDVEPAYIPDDLVILDLADEMDGLDFYGASLVHENKIAIRFYFSGSFDGVDLGEYTAIEAGDGLYYIEIADICPQDLGTKQYINLGDGAMVVGYSAEDYMIRMFYKDGVSESTKTLVQALYGYYQAAKALFAE